MTDSEPLPLAEWTTLAMAGFVVASTLAGVILWVWELAHLTPEQSAAVKFIWMNPHKVLMEPFLTALTSPTYMFWMGLMVTLPTGFAVLYYHHVYQQLHELEDGELDS